jgi:hypothetical protein
MSSDLDKDLDLTKDIQSLENKEKIIARDNNEIDSKIRLIQKFAWGAAIIGGLTFIIGIILLCFDLKINEFGDFVGGIAGPLLSLSGLFFVYIAFLGQQKQMKMQSLELTNSQIELKATRIELKGQKDQLIEQNSNLKIQRFENTFFNLISNFNQAVNSFDLTIQMEQVSTSEDLKNGYHNLPTKQTTKIPYDIKGKDCFHHIYENFKLNFHELSDDPNYKNSISAAKIAFQLTFSKSRYQSDLYYYFSQIKMILKIIDESDISNKSYYSDILQAQLSPAESKLIFYYCVGIEGNELLEFVRKYRLLEDLKNFPFVDDEHKKLIKQFTL